MTAIGPVRKTDTAEQTATLAEVDIRSELLSRPPRTPNLAAEDRALTTLAREMAENPRNMLQKLVEMAVELCDADTAGISLLEGEVFRWEAVAGVFASHRNGTMPRAASPCGVCIDQNLPQLMHLPDRCFPALRVEDRKSTRLNSSHGSISYAVFCLKKKKNAVTFFTGCTIRCDARILVS